MKGIDASIGKSLFVKNIWINGATNEQDHSTNYMKSLLLDHL